MKRMISLCAALAMGIFLFAGFSPQTAPLDDFEGTIRRLEAANAPYIKGLAAFNEGRFDKAESAFRACLEKFEDHAFAHYYLANIHYIRKDFAASLAAMDSALARFDAWSALGARLEERKTKDREALRTMLAASTETPMTCRDRRSIEWDQDALDDAAFAGEKASSRRSGMFVRIKAHFTYFRGNVLFQLQRIPEAFRGYEEAIRLDPRHAGAVNNLVAILFVAREYEKALAVLDKAESEGLEESLSLELKDRLFRAAGKPTEGILDESFMAGEGSARLSIKRFSLAYRQTPDAGQALYVNAYVASDPTTRNAILIDPGTEDARIEDFVKENGLRIRAVLATHAHTDHCGASRLYANRFGVPVYASRSEARSFTDPPDRLLRDGDPIATDGLAIRCLEIPGHTAGGLCYIVNGVVFSGDTLLRNGIGAPPGGSAKERDQARKKTVKTIRDTILRLPDSTLVCPGHGKATTVGTERANNPALAR